MTFAKMFLTEKPNIKDRLSSWLFPKSFSLNSEAVKNLLPSHLHKAAETLPISLKDFRLQKEKVILYYPGCGQDMVWPIITLLAIANDAKEWTIIGQDAQNTLCALICSVQEMTGQKVYSIQKSVEGVHAGFSFKDKKVNIIFSESDALEGIPTPASTGYDIYFERGFEILRNQDAGFFDKAITALNEGGLVIIDAPPPKSAKGLRKATKKMPEWGFYSKANVYLKEGYSL